MIRSSRNRRPEAPPAPRRAVTRKSDPVIPGLDESVPRKPRLIVAGEFSAGKTELINGLLGAQLLPSNVTATALPPIWLVRGTPAMMAVDLDGKSRKIEALADAGVEDTHYCAVTHPSPFLDRFDLIDTPGISDPNIPAISWERMMPFADAVIWCTNATQAWRQSEKSVWEEMPPHLSGSATLIVTHADRITDERSAGRVLRRVRREAKEYFSTFLMASLLKDEDVAMIRDTLEEAEGALTLRPLEKNRITLKLAALNPAEELPQVKPKPAPPGPVESGTARPAPVRLATDPSDRARSAEKKATPPADTPAAEIRSAPRVRIEAVPGEKTPKQKPETAPPTEKKPDTIAATVAALVASYETAPDVATPDAISDSAPNVHRLDDKLRSIGANAPQDSAGALWHRLSRSVDLSNPNAVLGCVRELIDTLDQRHSPVPQPEAPAPQARRSGVLSFLSRRSS